MATWNYRLVQHKSPVGYEPEHWFAVHEVHYDNTGAPETMSAAPVTFGGDTPAEVVKALERALKNARDEPVFDPPATWPPPEGVDRG